MIQATTTTGRCYTFYNEKVYILCRSPFIAYAEPESADDTTATPYETEPVEGYEIPTNTETGEQIPNCCQRHKGVFEVAKKWFEQFPDCCAYHREISLKPWFKKSNYNGLAEKIVKQFSYTQHLISDRIENNDWYEDITDYIEYNIDSFGHPAIGWDVYYNVVKYHIQNVEGIPKDKKRRLLEFIKMQYETPEPSSKKTEKTEKTDLNVLYSTYQKWFKIFPFDLSFFADIKPLFENKLYLINEKPKWNRYTKLASVKMHTKGTLIEALVALTDDIITRINTSSLYEEGLLTNPDKIKLELILKERKTKKYINNSQDEGQRYRKMLKEWFEDEKRFIKEITPFLNQSEKENTCSEAKETVQQPNTIKPKREIKTKELGDYFKNSFKGAGNGNINYFDEFIEDLKMDRTAKEFAEIALLAFEGGKMNDRKPKTFKVWYNIFCECVGCKYSKDYKPNRLYNRGGSIERLFGYLLVGRDKIHS